MIPVPSMNRTFDRVLYEQVVARVPYMHGCRLRRWWLRGTSHLAADAIIHNDVHIVAPGNLTMGPRAAVAPGAILDCRGGLRIGAATMVGVRSVILTTNHGFARRDVPMMDQGMTAAPVTVGADVWIGAYVVVLPGTTVGDGAILASSTVVNRDVPAGAIVGGVPGRVLRYRDQ